MEKEACILIVAGEASGDLHGSLLVEALTQRQMPWVFFGLGGERLQRAGVEIIFPITRLAVVGLIEVLKHLGTFRRIFDDTLREVDRRKPAAAILIDYPGFNLRLARELKKRGVPVIYYISPQVWAWGEKRIALIRRTVDLMLVLFPFEEALYRRHGVNAYFVGHPLLDTVAPSMSRHEFNRRFRLKDDVPTVALLPGSREREVKLLLPIMCDTAKVINTALPSAQFVILRAPSLAMRLFEEITARYRLPLVIVSGMTHEGLGASDYALVASGTATLECAILKVPMAILYKLSFLTWAYLKAAVTIPCVGLVNVVAGERIVPEFIQYAARPQRIARVALAQLRDPAEKARVMQKLTATVERLGEKGASGRAAERIIQFFRTR